MLMADSSILDSSIDGVLAFDLDLKVTVWNKQMERFSGVKAKECLNKPVFELFPLFRQMHGTEILKVSKGKICIVQGMPFNASLNNGLEDHYEGYYTPIRNASGIVGVMGIVREVGYRPEWSESKESYFEDEGLPEFALENVVIGDIFTGDELQALQDSFAAATGVACIMIDNKGESITRPSKPKTMFKAMLSDKTVKKEFVGQFLNQPLRDDFYGQPMRCAVSGLCQGSAPIRVGKKLIATWIIGEAICHEFGDDEVNRYAPKTGLDPLQYREALKEALPVTEEQFININNLLNMMAGDLTRQAMERVKRGSDFNDLQKIENRLKNINRRREELTRIINKSPVTAFLWRTDVKRTVYFVTENIRQFGYSQEDFKSGKTKFLDIVYGEDVIGLENDFRKFLLNLQEKYFTREYRIVTKHGGLRWVQERSWPRVDASGKIEFQEGLLLDITVRKYAEEALIASEEQFKLLFERAPIGMALLTIDNEILKINNAFSESIGYGPEELSTGLFTDFIYPDDKQLMVGSIKQDNRTHEYQLELRFLKKDGGALYSIAKIALIYDALGQPSQKLVQIVDITNRKKAEIELIASQNKLHQAQSFAHLGNWELDLSDNKVSGSDEFFKIYGYDKIPVEFTLNEVLEPVIPAFKDQIRISFNEFLSEKKQDLDEEYKITRRGDGKTVAVQMKAELVWNGNNNPYMVLGTVQDITDRKSIEEELTTRNAELTNFVYKVSHDLRSPLLSVFGLITLIKNNRLDEDTGKYLALIEERVHRLDAFIMDILSHSKNLYTEIQVEKIEFKKIIESAFDGLSYLNNYTQIKRHIHVAKKDFYSDPQRLKNIFRNLIANSIQYMHPSRKNAFVNVDVSVSERYASIVIEDNGLGIDKPVVPKIFDMFYRGIEISKGSGIGLYIVKQAVEKLGGSISVESEVSAGSKFFITLPNLSGRPAQKKAEG